MLRIECDLDATLADIYTPAEKFIKMEGYENFKFSNVRTYEGKHSGIGCPRVVRLKWLLEPKIYELAKLYEGAYEFVDKITSYQNVDFTINSKSPEKCRVAKTDFFNRVFPKKDNLHFLLDTSDGIKKMLDADVLIEDCLDNLQRSTANVKILINRSHNALKYNQKYKDLFEELYCVDDCLQAFQVIKDIYPEYIK